MKFKELKSMTNDEIEGKLKELTMELIKANAQIATGTVPKNPGQVKQTKKTIAKIKQILATPASEKQEEPKAEGKKETAEKKEEKKPAEEKIEQSSNSPKLESKIPNSQSEALRNSDKNLAKKEATSQSDKPNKNKTEEKQE